MKNQEANLPECPVCKADKVSVFIIDDESGWICLDCKYKFSIIKLAVIK